MATTGERRPGVALDDLVATMATLRTHCPWDRAQTHTSLRRHLLEETHEALEALDAISDADTGRDTDGDAVYRDLAEELGDVLFQVVFHAHIAAESDRFDLAAVIDGVREKLEGRHPDIFAAASGADDGGGDRSGGSAWERAKVVEKGRRSVMDGMPGSLPALAYTAKVIGKAGAVDPDLVADLGTTAGVEDDVELAARLIDTVADARRVGLDAESTLRAATRRIEQQVRAVEDARDRTSRS